MPILRAEACPLKWRDLDDAQRMAFGQVTEALVEAVREMPPQASSPSRTLGRRLSRLVFLSGDRGTGKTSLFLSLEQVLSKEDVHVREWFVGPAELAGPERSKAEERVIELRRRIVWLETLDMEPLGEPTNLLAALLARIETAARPVRQRSDEGDRRDPGQPVEARWAFGGTMVDLRRLQVDVALGWDGNVRERRGSLDPDPYAEEVLRSERVRLSLNPRLAALLDDLAREGVCGGNLRKLENPIFLLPVDDFDLHPALALDLLKLLRMISVPRLFCLVLGNLDIAEAMFNAKVSGAIAAVVGGAGSQRTLSIAPSELAGFAGSIAAHAMRKLVPPGQRVELGPMKVQEALRFHRPGEVGEPALRELLARFGVAIDTAKVKTAKAKFGAQWVAARTVESFLLSGTPDGTLEAEPRSPYDGVGILRAPPRQVSDLWSALKESARAIEGEGLAVPDRFVALVAQEACRVAREEELSPVERRVLLDAIGKTPAGEPILDSTNLFARHGRGSGPRVFMPDRTLVARALREIQLKVADPSTRVSPARAAGTPDEALSRPLSRRATAWIILYHDLLALRPEGGLQEGNLTPSDEAGFYASVTWRPSNISVSWPTPTWSSWWEFQLFGNEWNPALASVRASKYYERNDENLVSFLAYAWIRAITCVLDETRPAEIQPGPVPPEAWERLAAATGSLAEEVLQVPSRERQNPQKVDTWMGNLALLLAPEAGVPQHVAAFFLKQKALVEFWLKNHARVVEWRTARLRRFLEAGPSGVSEVVRMGAILKGAPRTTARDPISALGKQAAKHPINRLDRGILRPTIDVRFVGQPSPASVER
jgi:hypothetical protein